MPEFPDFLGKAVVHGQNLDISEFGKGALSELRLCGVAVKRKKVKATVKVGGGR